jgi:ArsR family transcriptional regulator, arsenate/arsenite/antimonite-responsive transcriptional repressor
METSFTPAPLKTRRKNATAASQARNLKNETATLKALAALAQTQRLRTFRALVMTGTGGLTPGAIAAELQIAPSALSFHLKELVHANLVTSEARGRNLIYRANFSQMNALLGYLTEYCCAGVPCETPTACVDC